MIRDRVKSPYQEPYFLCSKDGRRFRLEFDCKNCENCPLNLYYVKKRGNYLQIK